MQQMDIYPLWIRFTLSRVTFRFEKCSLDLSKPTNRGVFLPPIFAQLTHFTSTLFMLCTVLSRHPHPESIERSHLGFQIRAWWDESRRRFSCQFWKSVHARFRALSVISLDQIVNHNQPVLNKKKGCFSFQIRGRIKRVYICSLYWIYSCSCLLAAVRQ